MVELDITGVPMTLEDDVAARLRDAAAAAAGHSAAHRDLSLLLDRALTSQRRIVLQRGEARALADLLATDAFAATPRERGT